MAKNKRLVAARKAVDAHKSYPLSEAIALLNLVVASCTELLERYLNGGAEFGTLILARCAWVWSQNTTSHM